MKIITITEQEYREALEDGGGICAECLERAEGFVEPDAEKYKCKACGALAVYGYEQLLLMGKLEFSEEVSDE